MKYYLTLIALVCVAAALPMPEEEREYNADSRSGQSGRIDLAGGSRDRGRAAGAAGGSKGNSRVAGESGAERKQDYNKETHTVLVKSEKDSGSASEDEWAKGAGGARGSKQGLKVNAGRGSQKGGFGSSRGAGYEGADYEKGERADRDESSPIVI